MTTQLLNTTRTRLATVRETVRQLDPDTNKRKVVTAGKGDETESLYGRHLSEELLRRTL